jgi:signal transduction histidine kinase
VTTRVERVRQIERWIAWVRLAAVPFAVVEVGLLTRHYPPGHERWAWLATAVFAAGAVVLWFAARRAWPTKRQRRLGYFALAFDTAIVAGFLVLYYSFEPDTPIRQLLFLPVTEAAVRFGIRGGVVVPLGLAPFLALGEELRSDRFDADYNPDAVTFPLGLQILMGLIVGWLAQRLSGEAALAEARAVEAEELRDRLGRRADQLEAVNRCARALGSSLERDAAFDRFLRELTGVFSFDRLAIVLLEGDRAEVLATTGREHEALFPEGSSRPIAGSIVEPIVRDGQTVVRDDITGETPYAEERDLARAGLRSRVVAPLTIGGGVLGILSVCRSEVHAFERDEVDLITLLARQVASAVQNIRLYTAERNAAEELRRLSALRADFVSLVSHELRAPMASVIGCATTLRERWRELRPEQRESFLALIEQETNRLSTLVGDVLDTSRIEAGTFTYVMGDVDLGELVREVASMVALGQDDVSVKASVAGTIPPVHGDRDRLRQLLLNLATNAVKYTVAGDEIELAAGTMDGLVEISVADHGPGIPADQQRLVFEKFGRVNSGGKSKPGAGLGLFIARSIAEAHGGSLALSSEPGSGTTFTVRLPSPGLGTTAIGG